MPCSASDRAKRAFVSVLVALARKYGVAHAATRENPDPVIAALYRRVLLRCHPD